MIKYAIHLCPICGCMAESTGRICAKHYQITYDGDGNVLSYRDMVMAPDGWTSMWVPGETRTYGKVARFA